MNLKEGGGGSYLDNTFHGEYDPGKAAHEN